MFNPRFKNYKFNRFFNFSIWHQHPSYQNNICYWNSTYNVHTDKLFVTIEDFDFELDEAGLTNFCSLDTEE